MRLAVSIAAWSHDPDATLPPDRSILPQALRALGFSVMHVPPSALPESLSAALSGLEAVDTLLLHLSGVLDAEGSLEIPGADPLRFSAIADLLATKRCGPTLLFVEAAYRGAEDAFRAVEFVEAVAEALAADGAPHTTIIAVHPLSADAAQLAFTRIVLETVPEVVKSNGLALIDHAYTRARERQTSGVAANSFALMHGESPFYMTPVQEAVATSPLPLVPPAAETQPVFGAAVAEVRVKVDLPAVPEDRASTRAFDLVDVASSRPGAVARVSDRVPLTLVDTTMEPTLPYPTSVFAAAKSVPPEPAPPPPAPAERDPIRDELDARISAATAAGEHRLAVQLSRERLPSLPTVEGRVDELFEIGRTLVAKLRDLPEAVLTLEEARALDPSREDVLEALRRAYARLERWTETLEVTLALIKKTADARERAGLRVAAAALARHHLSDEDYALELLALAIEDDPRDEAALDEVVRIRRARAELVDLEHTLTALAGRLVEAGHAARAWDVCQRLAAVRRDDLGDTAGAVEALAIAKRLPLTELDSRAVLAEQLLALNDDEGAVAELEAIVAAEPLHLRAHARLFSIHHRSGDHDRA
ncbi:MAG: tetratricopeptide repeat protein [Polyangiaceae bacterium]